MSWSIYCVAESDGMDAQPCKIGMSANLKQRLCSLQSGNWRKLSLIWNLEMPLDVAKSIEWRTLTWFRPSVYTGSAKNGGDRLQSEWINASATEIFKYVKENYDSYELGKAA